MKLKKLVILFLLVSLSACGFHLRGLIDVPVWLNNVSIIAPEGNKELVSLLKSHLEGYKIKVNPDPAFAAYHLIINNSNFYQHIVSIGASTNPRQYQLVFSVNYSLRTPKGQLIKAEKNISVSRQLTVNNDRILGSDDEQTLLLIEMKRDIVIQLINQLSR